MNLGLSIFLSAVLICSIWLYYITRDRWNWKKIWTRLLKFIGIPLISILFVYGIIQLVKYIEWKNSENKIRKESSEIVIAEVIKPSKVETFSDVRLGTNKKDVIFYRGAPTRKVNDKLWLYEWGERKNQGQGKYDLRNYWVKNLLYFMNDKVVAVLKFYEGHVSYDAELMNN